MLQDEAPDTASALRAGGDGRMMAGRRSGRLSDRVRRHVQEKIVTGQLQPGSVIQIGALAEELGVSRTPAREALLSLQQAGLLQVIPNQGFLVRSISLADIKDIYVMRRVVEGATSERAAARLTDAHEAGLVEIQQRTSDSARDGVYDLGFDDLCHAFHRLIGAAADSERLLTAVEGIFGDVARLQSIGICPPDRLTLVAEHQAILDALLDRDTAGARRAMEAHIDTMRQEALAAVLE